jgi:predicted nucleotide-binding protein (sugar kinase/HSP70/actin superfamily)
MDQPTYTPVQKIVEATGTLYFTFGDLDAAKPVGSVQIRVLRTRLLGTQRSTSRGIPASILP